MMSIRPMYRSEQQQAIEVISLAMMDDPGWTLIESDPVYRLPLLRVLVWEQLEMAFENGGDTFVAVRDDKVAGALIWSPPGKPDISVLHYLAGIKRGRKLAMARPGTTVRTLRFITGMDAMKPTRPSAYIAFIGCGVQGQGIGKLLMDRALLAAGDAPTALETQNAANVAYYERFGFRVTSYLEHVYPGGPYNYVMERPAD